MVSSPGTISEMVSEMDFACTINFRDGTLHMAFSHFWADMVKHLWNANRDGRRVSSFLMAARWFPGVELILGEMISIVWDLF